MFTFFKRIRRALLFENNFRKYTSYAIGEIILVVLGILIALQINNWNTQRTNQENIRTFASSLIKELKEDINEIDQRLIQVNKINLRIDSLIHVLNRAESYDALNIDLLCLSWNLYYMPYKWNRSTIDQLKNSATLRHIKNDTIIKMIGKYDAFTKHLEEDHRGDQSRIQMLEPFINRIVNYNYPDIKSLRKGLLLEISKTENDNIIFYKHQDYLKARKENLPVLSNDPSDYNQLINKLVGLQFQYSVRDYELNNQKKDAKFLIQLLKREYSLEPH